MPPKWTYFSDEEVKGLNEDFVAKLDMARKIAGIPFVITSGLRTSEKNQSVIGSVPDSAHLKGLAVDLRVSSSQEVAKILDAASAVGIVRRGVYVNSSFQPIHVHLDDDPEKLAKTGSVVFIKKEGSNA